LCLFLVGLAAQLLNAPSAIWWTLYLACYLTGGWSPAWEGIQALRSRTLDVDLLMVVAAIGAAAIGQIFDGALLIVIFATSGALEDAATKRTEDSVKGLLDLAPERATRIDADGVEHSVNPQDLRVASTRLSRGCQDRAKRVSNAWRTTHSNADWGGFRLTSPPGTTTCIQSVVLSSRTTAMCSCCCPSTSDRR
jgi:hypothetical protein